MCRLARTEGMRCERLLMIRGCFRFSLGKRGEKQGRRDEILLFGNLVRRSRRRENYTNFRKRPLSLKRGFAHEYKVEKEIATQSDKT